jgi:hypothetical protein
MGDLFWNILLTFIVILIAYMFCLWTIFLNVSRNNSGSNRSRLSVAVRVIIFIIAMITCIVLCEMWI